MPARLPAAPSPPELATPEEAEDAFYGAFAALDLERMAGVWGDGEGVVCVHPGGGLLTGKAEVMQSWSEILTGVAPPQIEHRVLSRTRSATLCVHLVEESIRAGGDPRALPNRVLATNVYAREGTGWRLLAHHASLPLMERRGSVREERLLH